MKQNLKTYMLILMGVSVCFILRPLLPFGVIGVIIIIIKKYNSGVEEREKQMQIELEEKKKQLEKQRKEREIALQKELEEKRIREQQIQLKRQRDLEEKQKIDKQIQLQREQNALKEAIKVVTHYCPNCGLLIYESQNVAPVCSLCETRMKNACGEVELFHVAMEDPKDLSIVYEWTKELDELYDLDEYDKLLEIALPHLKDNNAIAQYYVALCKLETNESEYIKLIKKSAEQGYAPALAELGWAYYENKGVEKNNVLAQKYMNEAARRGSAYAYHYITDMCESGDFWWNDIVRNTEEGRFKAAIRGYLYDIIQVYKTYSGVRSDISQRLNSLVMPSTTECCLWWAIRAAEYGNVDSVDVIYRCCDERMKELSSLTKYKEAEVLYKKYFEIKKYWEKEELHLKYPDPDCYEGYMAEQAGNQEKAWELYKLAAERGDEYAIESVRRLTGDYNYKLKVGKLYNDDYKKVYDEAKKQFDIADYEACLMKARKSLEIYVHYLYYINSMDMAYDAKLYNSIKELYNAGRIDKSTYNDMNFVRISGNNSSHSSDKLIDMQLAQQVVEALCRIISER